MILHDGSPISGLPELCGSFRSRDIERNPNRRAPIQYGNRFMAAHSLPIDPEPAHLARELIARAAPQASARSSADLEQLLLLAGDYLRRGQPEQARRAYKLIVALAPTFYASHMYLGLLAESRGTLVPALASYDRALFCLRRQRGDVSAALAEVKALRDSVLARL
jgi:hypothetical protein